MPNTHVQYNYRQARDEWGPSVADSIWHQFPKDETQARATIEEDKSLKKEHKKAASVRSVIDEIVKRSLGRGD